MNNGLLIDNFSNRVIVVDIFFDNELVGKVRVVAENNEKAVENVQSRLSFIAGMNLLPNVEPLKTKIQIVGK
jgi:hypothetical protein